MGFYFIFLMVPYMLHLAQKSIKRDVNKLLYVNKTAWRKKKNKQTKQPTRRKTTYYRTMILSSYFTFWGQNLKKTKPNQAKNYPRTLLRDQVSLVRCVSLHHRYWKHSTSLARTSNLQKHESHKILVCHFNLVFFKYVNV